MPPVAQIPTELLDLYQALVQQAPDQAAAHQHLVNFLADAKTITESVQNILNAAQARLGQ